METTRPQPSGIGRPQRTPGSCPQFASTLRESVLPMNRKCRMQNAECRMQNLHGSRAQGVVRRTKAAFHEPVGFRSANGDCRLTDSLFDVERRALGRNALPCFPRLPWSMAPIHACPWMASFHEPCPFTPENGGRRSEIGWEGDALRSRQRFMAPIRVHSLEVLPTHEPRMD